MDLAWIPQLFFDLVGRVVPGIVLIAASFAVRLGPSAALREALQRDVFNFGVVVLWLVLAYFLGLVATQLWASTVGRLCKRLESSIDRECMDECLTEHNELQESLGGVQILIDVARLPRVFVMHDHLRLVAREEALRLLKLLAEQRLCHGSVVGFIILSGVNIWFYAQDLSVERAILQVAFLAALVACWKRSLRLRAFFATGTCTAWLSFASAQKLLSQSVSGGAVEGREEESARKRPTRGLKRTSDDAA